MPSKDDDKKMVYFISPAKKTNFFDQFERVDEIFQREQQPVFNSDFKVFKGRDIYQYISKYDALTKQTIYGYCVILDDSHKYDDKVLICPLYTKNMADNKFGINLGKIYGLSDSEDYFAALSEIKFVTKKRFRIEGKPIREAKSLCNLSFVSYFRILDSYKNIIDSIIKRTTDYSQNLLYGGKILTA